MKRRKKDVRKGSFFIEVLAMVLVVFCSVLLVSGQVQAESEPDPGEERVRMITSVYIEEGDTLWSIAEEYMTEEYDSIEEYVAELQQINHTGEKIKAGCYLSVPYYAKVD